ncbi:hypothetical protein QMK19_08260 [Streptomyces sp. H10-C2]|uniref:hypothetical protein n=1 Tax=unclassified Streptomyces TaxID=2593676 RepID=UPI0024BB86FA|nr:MULTISPECIES: hypothetical protein [unclassified Streptomyces]MDJ0344787.1 hypothetical protein [Streptomyces sp. PH10-H1]MDJ0369672.1 hypothetical protein [Streptomyces sp. H10-C2]
MAARPKPSTRFDRETGYRTVPGCVHADRIGLSLGEYASNGTVLPSPRRLRIRPAASNGTRAR